MSQHTATLESETDLTGFRREARALLAQLVPPECVSWHTRNSARSDLFAAAQTQAPAPLEAGSANLVVPRSFLSLCETVILHDDPGRFGLLYRLLWRLVHEPGLRRDPLDADRLRAQHMAQSVRRDVHKMKAFVRFRAIDGNDATRPLHAAWFEPEHHIVEAVAPFFVRRFTQMRWAILTPERSVRWDGEMLQFGPGGRRDHAPPPDAGEALWLAYYSSIFNPARLKLAAMQKEMPRKYWRNLPEADVIAPLAAEAPLRYTAMLAAPATATLRRVPGHARAEPAKDNDMTDPHAPKPSAHPEEALDRLRKATDRCRECPLGEPATQSVFGEGPVRAKLMMVGEQPGDQEDLRGRPFVGPAGRLLDQAIAQLGWSREDIYVTNAVKHFKFELRGKRRIHKTPAQREVAACLHWLESEIAQVRPHAFIALGATAAHALVGRHVAVMSERGQWLTNPQGQKVLITLHPSALLRGDPEEHASAFRQWLKDLSRANDYMASPKDGQGKRAR